MDLNVINLASYMDSAREAEHPCRSWHKSPIWKTIKRHRLVKEPSCRKCASEGETVPASHVAHVEYHRGNWALFATYDNTQSLCHKHFVQQRRSGYGSLHCDKRSTERNKDEVASTYLEKRRVLNLREVALRERRTIFTPMRHRRVVGRCLLPSSPFSVFARSTTARV